MIFLSDNVIVNIENSSPSSGSSGFFGSSTLETLLKYAIIIAVVVGIIFVVISVYLVVDNIEWITTALTTGFIGWLNPFDDPADDFSPGEAVDRGLATLPLFGGIYRLFRFRI